MPPHKIDQQDKTQKEYVDRGKNNPHWLHRSFAVVNLAKDDQRSNLDTKLEKAREDRRPVETFMLSVGFIEPLPHHLEPREEITTISSWNGASKATFGHLSFGKELTTR